MAAASDKLSLIAKIAASYLSHNSLSVDQIGALISSVGTTLELASKIVVTVPPTAVADARQPAVSVKKSVQRDFIVCLECRKRAVVLKRHLTAAHGMTPQQYREKWRLPSDYPMAPPAYSENRSNIAKAAGLGQKSDAVAKRKAKMRPKAVR